jgi:ADP-heptose:LPS heptosyltransferase
MSRDTIRSIAVVQLGRLGDMVLTTPLLGALDQLYPDARITVLVSPAAATVARYAPGVSDLFEVGRGPLGLFGATLRMRMRAFDLYIDPKDHRSSTSAALARATRSRRVIVHPSNGPRHFEPLPPAAPPGHFVDRMLAPVSLLAPDFNPERRPMLGLPSGATAVGARVRATLGERYAVVNISAGTTSRYWRDDRTMSLVKWLAERAGVVVVSAPADRQQAQAIAAGAAKVLAAETRDLLEVAAIVAGASLVVSPDTSVVHVASAYDIPTVGLYPHDPDNLRLFAPLASRSRAIMAPSGAMIADITTDEVIAAIQTIIG